MLWSIFCKELMNPSHRLVCLVLWSVGIVYALVGTLFVLADWELNYALQQARVMWEGGEVTCLLDSGGSAVRREPCYPFWKDAPNSFPCKRAGDMVPLRTIPSRLRVLQAVLALQLLCSWTTAASCRVALCLGKGSLSLFPISSAPTQGKQSFGPVDIFVLLL